jgi:hypothetical protein
LFPDYFQADEAINPDHTYPDAALFRALAANASDKQTATWQEKIGDFYDQLDTLVNQINNRSNGCTYIQLFRLDNFGKDEKPTSFEIRVHPQVTISPQITGDQKEDNKHRYNSVHKHVVKVTCRPSKKGKLTLEIGSHFHNQERVQLPLIGDITPAELQKYLEHIVETDQLFPQRVE